MTDDDIIAGVIEREGGYNDDNPADKGGPTKFGITIGTLQDWRGKAVSKADVENLSATEAREIYRFRYIRKPGFDRISDARLRTVLVDCAVLHGPANAIRFMQRALGVDDDGAWGKQTTEALQHADTARLFLKVSAERLRFFGRLISKDLTDKDRDGVPDNTEFAGGWLNRCAEMLLA